MVLFTEKNQSLNYGVKSFTLELDPQVAHDSSSMDIIDQVCEGLFGYNLTHPEMAIIPVLAENLGTWNAHATEYTVYLKHGVKFHDGTDFDANDVKFTFDRLYYLIENNLTPLAELYKPLAALYPETPLLINKTLVINDYTVTFYLNYPYVPLTSLLCFSGSYILPNSGVFPLDRPMNVLNETLIGTGPYEFIEQTDEQIQLGFFSDWHGERPDGFIERISIIKYDDDIDKCQDFLNGNLDWIDYVLPDFISQFELSSNHSVGQPRKSSIIVYLGMNNNIINRTMRQAISYAFDYDYVINNLTLGNGVRPTSPIPEGIMFHNPDLNYPLQNLTKARQILINAGVVNGSIYSFDDDEAWFNLTINNPISTYNYTLDSGNSFQTYLGFLVEENLKAIGIKVNLISGTWNESQYCLPNDHLKSSLFMSYFSPDYNDPSNYINNLFSNFSNINYAQVNDLYLQEQIVNGLSEYNAIERREIYYEIQRYIIEDLMPCVLLYVPLHQCIWRSSIEGIIQNPLNKLNFASIYWITIELNKNSKNIIPGYSLIALILIFSLISETLIFKIRR